MKSNGGKTLIRFLFIPLSVLLFAGVCVPAASEMLKQEETTDTANRYILAVRYARTQAREQNKPLTLCASVDGTQCSYSKDWSTGWILIDHQNQSVINAWSMLPNRLEFMAERTSIQFGENGFSRSSEMSLSMFDKACTINGGSEGRRITVTSMGKTSVQRTQCS